MTISTIIAILTGVLSIPGLLPATKTTTTIALVADAYDVYNDVANHRGLAAVSEDVQRLLQDLVDLGINLTAIIPGFANIPATIANYTRGDLAVLDSNFTQVGPNEAGKIYAVKNGGTAADIINKAFYLGWALVPPS